MTTRQTFADICSSLSYGAIFALSGVAVVWLGRLLFDWDASLLDAAVTAGILGVLTPLGVWLTERFPLLPDFSKHKKRLRELDEELERVARGEMNQN
jgi:hypothetical protein